MAFAVKILDPPWREIHVNHEPHQLERKIATLCKIGGKSKSLPNIWLFKIGKISQEFGDSSSSGQGPNDHAYRDAHSSYARLTAHDFRV